MDEQRLWTIGTAWPVQRRVVEMVADVLARIVGNRDWQAGGRQALRQSSTSTLVEWRLDRDDFAPGKLPVASGRSGRHASVATRSSVTPVAWLLKPSMTRARWRSPSAAQSRDGASPYCVGSMSVSTSRSLWSRQVAKPARRVAVGLSGTPGKLPNAVIRMDFDTSRVFASDRLSSRSTVSSDERQINKNCDSLNAL